MKRTGLSTLFLVLACLLLPGCGGAAKAPVSSTVSAASEWAAGDASSAVSSERAADAASSTSDTASSGVSSGAASDAAVSNAASSTSPASSGRASVSSGGAAQQGAASSRVVCIDPGHQKQVDLSTEPVAPGAGIQKLKNPGGAEGVATKVPEYQLNLAVAQKVRALLLQQGYTVVMTRENNDGNISNIDRAQVANNCKAGLFLRIHADSVDQSSVTGISIQIPGGQYIKDTAQLAASKEAGRCILDGMLAATGAKSRGLVTRDDMTGFNWCTRPEVLVEMGFMSNPGEDRLMETDAYQSRLAQGMADGVARFFAPTQSGAG